MEAISLGIKFVKANEPLPGPESYDGITQTGDFTVILILCLFALLTVGLAVFLYRKYKYIQYPTHANSSAVTYFKTLKTTTKFSIAAALVLSCICIVSACFSTKANASSNDGQLVPDKTEITAVVAKDGSITSETCSLTNISTTERYIVDNSKVVLSDEVKYIQGLENSQITINGFGGVVFNGMPNGQVFQTEGLQDLEITQSTELSFRFVLSDLSIIEQLYDKNIFNLELTPAKKEVKKINFKNVDGNDYFPVFDTVPAGTGFYSKDGKTSYTSMSEGIDHAVVLPGTTINVIREIGTVSWNEVYGGGTPAQQEAVPIDEFKEWNLVFKDGKYLEEIPSIHDADHYWQNPPIVFGIDFKTIWNVYKNVLGGHGAEFLSSYANSADFAYVWDTTEDTWAGENRVYSLPRQHLLVTRVLS